MVWKLFAGRGGNENKAEQNFVSATDTRNFKARQNKRLRVQCPQLPHKTLGKFNQAYNKITKLIIPQKTSENIDNLHIDLLSKTLPVERNNQILE